MEAIILKLEIDRYIEITFSSHNDNRISSMAFAGWCGWVGQYKKGETLFEILTLEIADIRKKIKNDRYSKKELKRLLKGLENERLNQSQLTLF